MEAVSSPRMAIALAQAGESGSSTRTSRPGGVLVLRRDYLMHKRFASESVDGDKRFLVAAGINTRDHAERVPALVDAGADLLCIDSSDGYTTWQARTLEFVRDTYGGRVLRMPTARQVPGPPRTAGCRLASCPGTGDALTS
jgi:hypothetical protein